MLYCGDHDQPTTKRNRHWDSCHSCQLVCICCFDVACWWIDFLTSSTISIPFCFLLLVSTLEGLRIGRHSPAATSLHPGHGWSQSLYRDWTFMLLYAAWFPRPQTLLLMLSMWGTFNVSYPTTTKTDSGLGLGKLWWGVVCRYLTCQTLCRRRLGRENCQVLVLVCTCAWQRLQGLDSLAMSKNCVAISWKKDGEAKISCLNKL